MEIDVDDILNDDSSFEKELLDKIEHDDTPPEIASDPEEIDSPASKVGISKDIIDLDNRLKVWHANCRDLFVDLRSINYIIEDEDTFIEFHDKNYFSSRLYFKADPQSPKDEKIIHATKQLCKIMSIPYGFFASCRPTLKMNIFKTWQAGLADDNKKSQNILKIRESRGCTIIRAITPTTKSIMPLNEIIEIIKESLNVPFKMECAYGDEKDDLIMHARFLFDKEYTFKGPVNLGFAITASELDACPLSIDVLLFNSLTKTYSIASYGGEAFFKSDYVGLQASSLKEILPAMLSRFEDEVPDIFSRLEKKQESFYNSVFCAETEAVEICKAKGISSKIKKAIFHQVSECIESIKSPWDLAAHAGLVAKDFDVLKRIKIEKAIGNYLNLFFSEGDA